jgi:serine/threonine protein kinase
VELLSEFENKNIAHRDIKTENIIITSEGWKLSDLGLVRIGKGSIEYDYAGSPDFVSPLLKKHILNQDISGL